MPQEETSVSPGTGVLVLSIKGHPMFRGDQWSSEWTFIQHIKVKCTCGQKSTHLIEQTVLYES